MTLRQNAAASFRLLYKNTKRCPSGWTLKVTRVKYSVSPVVSKSGLDACCKAKRSTTSSHIVILVRRIHPLDVIAHYQRKHNRFLNLFHLPAFVNHLNEGLGRSETVCL